MSTIHPQNLPHISIKLRPNSRARRLTLRQSTRDGGFTVSYPKSTRLNEIDAFINTHEGWIRRHYKPTQMVSIGSMLPFRGEDYTIEQGDKRGVRFASEAIYVKSPNVGRALAAALKSQAQIYANAKIDHFANLVGSHVNEIRWRDTKSRWGSCDERGNIMLSWRLIMMPDWIFDYVIAHECAHLVHMDHSHRFWALLEKIYPETPAARTHLRRIGKEIQSIIFDAS